MSRGNQYFGVENGDESQSQGSQSPAPSSRISRSPSFAVMRDSAMCWIGEQAQAQFLDRNLEAHANSGNADDGSSGMRSVSSVPKMIMPTSYNSFDNFSTADQRQIRFQVIVWSVGCPDVKNDQVSMKFRVTLFWNDHPPLQKEDSDNALNNVKIKRKRKTQSIWVMAGRSAAYKKKMSETHVDMIDIPPISILNADSFDIVGQPEVQLLREDSRLMRWSCMYRAKLHQDDMKVNEFPHDTHNLSLKLGILSQRQPGGRWDRRKWMLGLANESDTQGSIRIPYGLIVDHVKIPEFEAKSGLDFELSELKHGSYEPTSLIKEQDFYLKVKLKVKRNSGYYDKNIMPLLSVLNLVSISILTLDGDNYFQRTLLSLNIAFVEVGLRMALDAHLPSVGYQIKLQRILNFYFYSILSVALESSVLKFLITHGEWSVASTRKIDFIWAICLLLNQAYMQLVYSFDHSSKGTKDF